MPSGCQLVLAMSRSSSREVRVLVFVSSAACFSGGTLPKKKG